MIHPTMLQGTGRRAGSLLITVLLAFAALPAALAASNEVLFIDGSVKDASVITAAAKSGVEVVTLDPKSDEFAQIGATLAREHGLKAVHIVSHGAPGELILGGKAVDETTLAKADLSAWRNALAANGDILLYGCDVAQGAKGTAFIDALVAKTGANVEASTNRTGAVQLGGDWTLEASTGAKTAIAFTAAVEKYAGVLTTETYNTEQTGNALDNWHKDSTGATAGPNPGTYNDFTYTYRDSSGNTTADVFWDPSGDYNSNKTGMIETDSQAVFNGYELDVTPANSSNTFTFTSVEMEFYASAICDPSMSMIITVKGYLSGSSTAYYSEDFTIPCQGVSGWNGGSAKIAPTSAWEGLSKLTFTYKSYSPGTTGTSITYFAPIVDNFTYVLITPAAAPTATTGSASGIDTTAATLNGTVTPNGAVTSVSFEYGTTTGYGSTVAATTNPSVAANASATACSSTLPSLSPNTTYHFRVKATNSVGTTYGSDATFATSIAAPTATTGSATSITASSVTLNGKANANNSNSAAEFRYSSTDSTLVSYTMSTATPGSVSGTSDTDVTLSLTHLTGNTTYYYRVVAENLTNFSLGYGQINHFTTLPSAPTISSVTNGDAQATVNFTPKATDGGAETVTYTATAYVNNVATALTATGSASPITVTGLSDGTAYTFVVTASTSEGSNDSVASGSVTPAASVKTITEDGSVTENSSEAHVVTLTNPSTVDTTYSLAINGGSHTFDAYIYSFSSGLKHFVFNGSDSFNLTIPAGVSTFTIYVTPEDDGFYEGTESYTLTLGNYTTGTVTINDAESAPTVTGISVDNSIPAEGSTVTYTVNLSTYALTDFNLALQLGKSGDTGSYSHDVKAVTVNYGGSDITVTPASDGSATLDVPANVSSFTVSVQFKDEDLIYEGNRTLTLGVGTYGNQVTINDDADYPSVSVSGESVEAGNDSVFTVSITGSYTQNLSISLSVNDGTAYASVDYDNADADWTITGANWDPANSLIDVPAGTTSFTITVPTYDSNNTYTDPIDFYCDLDHKDSDTSVNLVSASGTGTLVFDADYPAVMSVGDASAGNGTAVVHTVTLSNYAGVATTQSIALTGVTAVIGTDTGNLADLTFSDGVTYDSGTGKITVPMNVMSFTVSVPTIAYHTEVSDKTYTLTIGGMDGTGTITDVSGYSHGDPFYITSSNAASYTTMDGATSSYDFYYATDGQNMSFESDVVFGATGGTNHVNHWTIDKLSVVSTGTGNLAIGSTATSQSQLTINGGSILKVGGNLTLNGASEQDGIAVKPGCLVMVDGTASSSNGGFIELYGGSRGGSVGGCFAIKGNHTLSSITSSLALYVWDTDTNTMTVANATNALAIYFDGVNDVYADSYLAACFPSVDMTGYTVVCFSDLNLSAFDFGYESNYWFSNSWYKGFIYYAPSYGCNFWSTVHGWQYGYASNTDTNTCVWDYGTASWWYTNKTLYPWFYRYTYDSGSTTWGGNWYMYSSGSAGSRQFYGWTEGADVNEADMPAPGY